MHGWFRDVLQQWNITLGSLLHHAKWRFWGLDSTSLTHLCLWICTRFLKFLVSPHSFLWSFNETSLRSVNLIRFVSTYQKVWYTTQFVQMYGFRSINYCTMDANFLGPARYFRYIVFTQGVLFPRSLVWAAAKRWRENCAAPKFGDRLLWKPVDVTGKHVAKDGVRKALRKSDVVKMRNIFGKINCIILSIQVSVLLVGVCFASPLPQLSGERLRLPRNSPGW